MSEDFKNMGNVTTRRGAGEGTVDQLPSGKHRVRIRTREGRKSTTFATEGEAEQFRAGAAAIYAEAPAEETLGTYGAKWLDRRELSGEHRAIHTERGLWRTHVEGSDLADVPLAAIERRDVKAWLDGMKAKKARKPVRGATEPVYTDRPLSRSTIHGALVLVRQCLQGALDDDLIATNPARELRVGKRAAAVAYDPWTYLTPAEIELVRGSPAIPIGPRTYFLTALFSGCRQGELIALTWDRVHIDDGRSELDIRKSHGGPTKSGKPRVVPLFEAAAEALHAWRRVCPTGLDNPGNLVFPAADGSRRKRSDDYGWADEAIALKERRAGGPTHRPGYKTLAGIERDVRYHDLRHAAASHLVMGSWGRAWKIEEVKEFLGHADIRPLAHKIGG